jgi:hypothetical protein
LSSDKKYALVSVPRALLASRERGRKAGAFRVFALHNPRIVVLRKKWELRTRNLREQIPVVRQL